VGQASRGEPALVFLNLPKNVPTTTDYLPVNSPTFSSQTVEKTVFFTYFVLYSAYKSISDFATNTTRVSPVSDILKRFVLLAFFW